MAVLSFSKSPAGASSSGFVFIILSSSLASVFPGLLDIALVLGKGVGEIVLTRPIILGHKEMITSLLGPEHTFDGAASSPGNGSRRQALVLISVVWRWGLQLLVAEIANGEVPQYIVDGGAGLKGHADAQSVVEHTGNEGTLMVHHCLLFHYGGQG